MPVRTPKTSLRFTVAALLTMSLAAQEQKVVGYPQRDALSPFRNPTEVYAPPDEAFRVLRLMQELADDPRLPKSYDDRGREVIDHVRWRDARVDLHRIGLDAGYLAQIMRQNRSVADRATAFYAAFYVENPGHVIELIEHIPGEPERKTRQAALPRAVEFLRKHLQRTFGDLTKEQQEEVRRSMPQPGSPAAKARGIARVPEDADTLHGLRVVPFLQMLDLDDAMDQAQALWFLKEVFALRLDLAVIWLEPSLPRIRQLLQSESAPVRTEAIGLLRAIGSAKLREAPADDPRALVAWADEATKNLFPPIRNLNDAIVQLHPSPERDSIAMAGTKALETSSIGDAFHGQRADGKALRGFRVARVPDELKELAIPAGAIITTVNGIAVADAGAVLRAVREQLALQRHPRRLLVEYVRDDVDHAIEYRVQ